MRAFSWTFFPEIPRKVFPKTLFSNICPDTFLEISSRNSYRLFLTLENLSPNISGDNSPGDISSPICVPASCASQTMGCAASYETDEKFWVTAPTVG